MRLTFAILAMPALVVTMMGVCAATTRYGGTKSTAPPDPRVWSIARGEDTYALRLALPREVDPAFAVTCQPSARLLQISVAVKSRQVASGDAVPLALSNGKRRLELAATAFSGSTNGELVAEAAVALDARVFDVLREGETLVVRLPGETQKLPLAGAHARLVDFERVCLARR